MYTESSSPSRGRGEPRSPPEHTRDREPDLYQDGDDGTPGCCHGGRYPRRRAGRAVRTIDEGRRAGAARAAGLSAAVGRCSGCNGSSSRPPADAGGQPAAAPPPGRRGSPWSRRDDRRRRAADRRLVAERPLRRCSWCPRRNPRDAGPGPAWSAGRASRGPCRARAICQRCCVTSTGCRLLFVWPGTPPAMRRAPQPRLALTCRARWRPRRSRAHAGQLGQPGRQVVHRSVPCTCSTTSTMRCPFAAPGWCRRSAPGPVAVVDHEAARRWRLGTRAQDAGRPDSDRSSEIAVPTRQPPGADWKARGRSGTPRWPRPRPRSRPRPPAIAAVTQPTRGGGRAPSCGGRRFTRPRTDAVTIWGPPGTVHDPLPVRSTVAEPGLADQHEQGRAHPTRV